MSLFKIRKNKIFEKGFSLVEMSTVLASVAIVATMVAGGTSLINKSHLNKFVSEVKGFSISVDKFQKQYKAIPGDIANVGAIDGTNLVAGGNTAGNGIIDSDQEA